MEEIKANEGDHLSRRSEATKRLLTVYIKPRCVAAELSAFSFQFFLHLAHQPETQHFLRGNILLDF